MCEGDVAPLVAFSPAKINLFLAVTGRRPDGFHDLVSLVAPLEFGDTLSAECAADGNDSLQCDNPAVPCDDTNLVLRAAKSFRQASGWAGGFRFALTKRIPMGAGLGGGSSNAVAALKLMNQLAGKVIGEDVLLSLAGKLGSDCPLFFSNEPIVMRGRGERIEKLAGPVSARLRGQRLLVFKPSFGVATAWAYARLAAGAPGSYLAPDDAERRLKQWTERADARAGELLFNNFQPAVFAKYVALPTLLDALRAEFRLNVQMSGSGSACFALLEPSTPTAAVIERIQAAWGDEIFLAETRIA